MSRSSSTKFVVDLGKVKLPGLLEKQLEREFQKLALSALAEVDFRGDIKIGELPPGVYGYIIGDWPPYFPPDILQPGQPQFGVRDHTTIVQTVMDHPLQLVRLLGSARKAGRKPTDIEVLEATLQLPNIEPATERAVRSALQLIQEAKEAEKALPKAVKAALEQVNKRIDATDSLEETVKVLQSMQQSGQYEDIDGMSTGIELAIAMFEDGRSTIYSPDYGFYGAVSDTTTEKKAADDAKDVGKADFKGAVSGAVGGAITGAGAVLTGTAVGAGASVAEVAGKIWDWIFD